MATRMQQRRGTAAQWISTNEGDGPILNAGEIGFETDTGKFKIGDGVNHWVDLDYFLDESDITGITGSYVESSTLGQANGVATLDANAKLTASQLPGIEELAQDAVDLALVAGTGISKTYNDNANTITIAVDTSVIATKAELAEVSQDSINDALIAGTGLDKSYDDNANTITLNIDSTVTTNTGSQTLSNKTINLANNTVSGTTAEFNTALSDANFVTTGDTGTVTSTMLADETIVNADIANNAAIAQSKIDGLTTDLGNKQDKVAGVSDTEIGYLDGVTSNVQAQLDAKAALSGATFTGNVVMQQDLQVDGTFTVNGSNVIVSATQIQIEDTMIQLGHTNAANTTDLGLFASYNDGTQKHSGLIKDVSDSGKWKLFDGVTTEPATTVDFTQGTLDTLVVGALETTTLSVGNVSSTEISYLDGVTSNVQAQIDSKLASSTAASTYAPLSGPTFTGTVTLPSTTSVGNVSATEIGYLDGLTSNVQAQLDGKALSNVIPSITYPLSINTANYLVEGQTDTNINYLAIELTEEIYIQGTSALDAQLNLIPIGSNFTITDNSNVLATGTYQKLGTTSGNWTVVTYISGTQFIESSSLYTITGTASNSGKFLSNDGTVSSWEDLDLSAAAPAQLSITSQSSSFTLALSDTNKLIEVGGAATITVPPASSVAFPQGTQINLLKTSSDVISVAGGSGVTVNGTPGLKLRAQWSSATLIYRGSDYWVLVGDLSA